MVSSRVKIMAIDTISQKRLNTIKSHENWREYKKKIVSKIL